MKIEFKGNNKGKELYEIYTRRSIARFPVNTEQGFRDAVDIIRGATTLNDLNKVRSLNFERYDGGKYKGKYSVRCCHKFRLFFSVNTSPELVLVLEDIKNYHG